MGDWATVDMAVERLNSMLKCDPDAINALMDFRALCRDGMAKHPTAQVGADDNGRWMIGMLGVINGLFGVIPSGPKEGWGWVTAVLDDDGRVSRFEVTDDGLSQDGEDDEINIL